MNGLEVSLKKVGKWWWNGLRTHRGHGVGKAGTHCASGITRPFACVRSSQWLQLGPAEEPLTLFPNPDLKESGFGLGCKLWGGSA